MPKQTLSPLIIRGVKELSSEDLSSQNSGVKILTLKPVIRTKLMSPDPTLELESMPGSNQGSKGVLAELTLALSSTDEEANKLPDARSLSSL